MKEQHSSHFLKIGGSLHQILNLRNENLLWTPVRRCIWSAKRTWVMLKWIPWRNRAVLRLVITANGEVQTHEEATVYVKELDIFMTMKVLENTPAVLSLGKLCDENGYSYEWMNGQTRRTSFLLWFQACQVRPLVLHQLQRHLQDRRVIPHHLLQPLLLHRQ